MNNNNKEENNLIIDKEIMDAFNGRHIFQIFNRTFFAHVGDIIGIYANEDFKGYYKVVKCELVYFHDIDYALIFLASNRNFSKALDYYRMKGIDVQNFDTRVKTLLLELI